MTHPSVNAPPLRINPISPVERMERNARCWCNSGLKYKKCHLNREQQEPANIFQVEAELLANLRTGYCSYPDQAGDPCASTISKSHTIQKKGGLAAIAENGHVLTLKPTMKGLIEAAGDPSPRKIGVNQASVFPGFCSKHDTSVFQPIEGKTLSFTKDTAFLFAYRAIAYERFAKEAQLKGVAAQREMDRGQPFLRQAQIQTHLNIYCEGVQRGKADTVRWKAAFDRLLLSGNRDDFHFVAVRFDRIIPAVACAAFHPEFDLSGRPLQRLGRQGPDLDHATLTVTVFNNQTVAIFGWIGPDHGPAAALSDSFVNVPADRKADMLIRLLFVQTDNLFLQPSWWNSLLATRQNAYKRMFKAGTMTRNRSADDLFDDGISDFAANVEEIVRI